MNNKVYQALPSLIINCIIPYYIRIGGAVLTGVTHGCLHLYKLDDAYHDIFCLTYWALIDIGSQACVNYV